MLVKTAKELMQVRLMRKPLKEAGDEAGAEVRVATGATEQAGMHSQAVLSQVLL